MTDLTEAEIRALDGSLADSGCHGFLGDHPNLYAAVQRVIDARLAPIRALLADGPDTWEGYESRDTGSVFLRESVEDFTADLRAALDAPQRLRQPHDGTGSQPQVWENRLEGTDVAEQRMHLEVDQGRVSVHEVLLVQLLDAAGWERAR